MSDEQDGAGVEQSDNWKFESGDTITKQNGDRFEVKRRFVDVDRDTRYYRLSHKSNSVKMLGNAKRIERAYDQPNV